MAWRRPGDKPLSEPMMFRLPTHICITRPQWVKKHQLKHCRLLQFTHKGHKDTPIAQVLVASLMSPAASLVTTDRCSNVSMWLLISTKCFFSWYCSSVVFCWKLNLLLLLLVQVSNLADDDMATPVARSSTAMILTKFPHNHMCPAQKGLTKDATYLYL